MKQEKRLQVIDVSRGRKRRRKRIPLLVRVLFFLLGVILLLYAVILGLAWYQKHFPDRSNWEYLKNKATTFMGEKDLTKRLQELGERNEEAREFVEGYEKRAEYLGREIDLSEDVTEGQVPLFMQWDKRWGYESFGSSNIGLAGCGPTCLSMAYVYFTGDLQGHPGKMAVFCEEEGYYTGQGTEWSLWTLGVKDWGLKGEELPLDEVQMRAALDEGALIVCSMRQGDFTTTGHYILIVGYEEEGFRVNDPNRHSNSEKTWSYAILQGQIRNLWRLEK